jgi:hypothetical protein
VLMIDGIQRPDPIRSNYATLDHCVLRSHQVGRAGYLLVRDIVRISTLLSLQSSEAK